MDHYQTLGVSRDADRAAIRAAYRALAKLHHPDMGAKSSVRFHEITQAHEVLSDPGNRTQYDLLLRFAGGPTGTPAGQRTHPSSIDKTQRTLMTMEMTFVGLAFLIGLVGVTAYFNIEAKNALLAKLSTTVAPQPKFSPTAQHFSPTAQQFGSTAQQYGPTVNNWIPPHLR